MNAPSHFIRGVRSIEAVPIQRFFGRVAKIDVPNPSRQSVACRTYSEV